MRTRLDRCFPFLLGLALLTGCPYPPGGSDDNNPLVQEAVGLSATDPQRAVQLLERALEGNPKLARAHRELGNLYYQQTNGYATAIYHYQKYLKLEPKSKWKELIEAQIKQSTVDLARDVLGPMTDLGAQRRIQALLAEKERLTGKLDELTAEVAKLKADLRLARNGRQATPQPSGGNRAAQTRTGQSTTTTRPTPATPAGKHTIKSGETLAALSRRYGVSLTAMKQANPGINYNRLRIGQVVNLPPGARR